MQKILWKYPELGKLWEKKRTPTLSSSYAIKIILPKQDVLIMRIIIHIIINMEDIKQVKPSESPILNLIKRLK